MTRLFCGKTDRTVAGPGVARHVGQRLAHDLQYMNFFVGRQRKPAPLPFQGQLEVAPLGILLHRLIQRRLQARLVDAQTEGIQ